MTDATALWTKDFNTHQAPPNIGDLLKKAAENVRRNPLALTYDWWKIKKAPGRLTFSEYLDFRVWDKEAFADELSRQRFLSDELHWSMCYQCSDRKWDAATEDKWISEILMRQSGIRTTHTLGILGGPERAYGPVNKIESADQFDGFLRDIGKPVFAKMNGGIASEGAMRISPTGDGHYEATGLGTYDAAGLYNIMNTAPAAYLLQEELHHHPEMSKLFGKKIGTIRAMTFVPDGKGETPFTVLKLPAGKNVADNFWRDGNMLVDVDENTGKVRRLIRGKGPTMEVLDSHPETGVRVEGMQLPLWDDVRKTIGDVAALYSPVKFQSLDLAIAEDGPTIVEINTGGAFNLPQIASGKGMLSDEVIDLWHQCGATLDTSKLKQ